MLETIKLFFLKNLYRFLVVKVFTVDREMLPSYHKFHTFCDLGVDTNIGRFYFSFKEDRRMNVRSKSLFRHSLFSYLVEMTGEPLKQLESNPLKDKVIVVIVFRFGQPNYKALAQLLLDLYIHHFSKK